MIVCYEDFLNPLECEYFTNLYDENINGYCDDEIYKFYFIDLMNKKLPIEKFSTFIFKKFRVQVLNESINQSIIPHRHVNPWSFIIFLNDNFTGGEVIFDNTEYKPKIGEMIYFSGEEIHKVNNCIGNRYTLVGFMNNNPMNVKKNTLI
jgi:hypothetical protein